MHGLLSYFEQVGYRSKNCKISCAAAANCSNTHNILHFAVPTTFEYVCVSITTLSGPVTISTVPGSRSVDIAKPRIQRTDWLGSMLFERNIHFSCPMKIHIGKTLWSRILPILKNSGGRSRLFLGNLPSRQPATHSTFSAAEFLTFLEQKVKTIRSDTAGSAPPIFTPTNCSFASFTQCT